MQRRYQAVLYKPELGPYGRQWTPVQFRAFRSIESARRQCQRWLDRHEIVTSHGCFRRDLGRAWAASVFDLKRRDRAGRPALVDVGELCPPICIVPSVGELGYTP